MQQLYIEPNNEEILGSFLQANETLDGVEAQPVSKMAKMKRKQTDKTADKRTYAFFNTETRLKRPSAITIDE